MVLSGEYIRYGHAQESNRIVLSPPDIREFPSIQALLDVHGQAGNFVSGIKPGHITILENGQNIQASEVNLLRPGAQVVFIVNPGPSFAIRDSKGLSRFDYLVQHISDWAESQERNTEDDLSMLRNDAADITHIDSVERWLTALFNYKPDARNMEPNYDILSRGLEVAADPPPRTGMGRVVIFVTSLPEETASVGLQTMISRALENNIQVNILLVASPERFTSQGALQLKEMAAQTGGGFWGYSGLEALPDFEAILEPNRSVYLIKYRSLINSSGTHQLMMKVTLPDFDATSNEQSFDLDILPPNIAFVSPVREISRGFIAEDRNDPDDLIPKSHSIDVLIEFPDGYQRAIEQSTLYVDGVVESKNTTPPFEKFTWDLKKYIETGNHQIQVEVLDEIGLNNSTSNLPVQVIVEPARESFLRQVNRNRLLLIVVAVPITGIILFLFLVMAGYLQPDAFRNFRRRRKKTKSVAR